MLAYQSVDHGTLTPVDPTIFKAKKDKDPYEPGLVEKLHSPQSAQWTESMIEEINNSVKLWTWDVIHKYELPEGARIIVGTWDFKCKRFPDGSFQKFKARFCVREDIQKRLSNVPMNNHTPMVDVVHPKTSPFSTRHLN